MSCENNGVDEIQDGAASSASSTVGAAALDRELLLTSIYLNVM
jgi:hypothetical protein